MRRAGTSEPPGGPRTFWLAIAFLSLALVAVACKDTVRPSGTTADKSFDLADFDEIEASHAFDVTVTRGDSYRVEATVSSNLIDHLVIEKRGNALHIGLEPNIRVVGTATLDVAVTMPALKRVDLSGASHISLDSFPDSGNVSLEASGASHISGELSASEVSIDLSGASSISLTGSAAKLTIDLSGASHGDLRDFPADDAAVYLSGASSADVEVSGSLDPVDLSGASTLTYGGDPQVAGVDVTGASSLKQR